MWFYAPLQVRVRVIIQRKGQVLLVKNWFGPHQWELPGGGLKFGESLQAAASREVNEELSILKPAGHYTLINKEPKIVSKNGLLMRNAYLSVHIEDQPIEIVSSREIVEYKWFDKDSDQVKTLAKVAKML